MTPLEKLEDRVIIMNLPPGKNFCENFFLTNEAKTEMFVYKNEPYQEMGRVGPLFHDQDRNRSPTGLNSPLQYSEADSPGRLRSLKYPVVGAHQTGNHHPSPVVLPLTASWHISQDTLQHPDLKLSRWTSSSPGTLSPQGLFSYFDDSSLANGQPHQSDSPGFYS